MMMNINLHKHRLPKKHHKIFIPNNENYNFTRYILSIKGENIKNYKIN